MRRPPSIWTHGPASTATKAATRSGWREREGQAVEAAHRHADHDHALEVEVIEQRGEVAGVGVGRVVEVVGPLGVAVPALVEREAMELAAQRQAAQVPGARGLTAAVQEQDRRPPGRAPVEIVEAHAAEHGVAGARATTSSGELEARELGGEPVVLALVFGDPATGGRLGHGCSPGRAIGLLRLV